MLLPSYQGIGTCQIKCMTSSRNFAAKLPGRCGHLLRLVHRRGCARWKLRFPHPGRSQVAAFAVSDM
jgi:hypothetical protein